MKKLFTLSIILLIGTLSVNASQEIFQNVRGQVVDRLTQTPLIGANIIISGTEPLLGTITDVDGNFTISNVPVGRVTITATYMGYKFQQQFY
jgi:hypothetical protein